MEAVVSRRSSSSFRMRGCEAIGRAMKIWSILLARTNWATALKPPATGASLTSPRRSGVRSSKKAMIRVCDSGSSWMERASVRPRLLAATTMAVCSGRMEMTLCSSRGESQWPSACTTGVAITQVASTFWSNWRSESIIRPNTSSRPTTRPQLPSRCRR